MVSVKSPQNRNSSVYLVEDTDTPPHNPREKKLKRKKSERRLGSRHNSAIYGKAYDPKKYYDINFEDP